MAVPPPDPAGDIADHIQAFARRLRHVTRDRIERLGVTWSQLRLLRQVVDAGEPMRMSDLAARLAIVPRSATSLVDGLQAADLVTRSPHPTDRRVTLVTPTRRGRRVVESARRQRREAIAPLVGRLTEAEQTRLLALLERMAPDQAANTA